MVGTIAMIWTDGVLYDNGKPVAGPGERIYVDSLTCERYLREGKAKLPPRK